MKQETKFANVPMKSVGPVKLAGGEISGEFMLPLATYETPLWPSVARGARISRLCDGIAVAVADERMTRSILLRAPNAIEAIKATGVIKDRRKELQKLTAETSRFAKLLDIHPQVVGNLIYLRLEFETGDAAGHNMTTKAADSIMAWLLDIIPGLQYASISANYCTDKKVSAVNGILGRGKYTVAELLVPHEICEKYLRTSPAKMADLNVRKNLIGSNIAGSLRSANAHYANMLLAFYLATGQDAANIVEGSQGITHVESRADDLYFSVTLPNLIVGTVGSGKGLDHAEKNLELLGCTQKRESGVNSRRLAMLAAAAVLCGELSLMAAQTNPGELMKAHQKLERKG